MRHLVQVTLVTALALVLTTACSSLTSDPYGSLLVRFDLEAPGHGLDAYTPTQVLGHAMAYAQFASAEAHRFTRTNDPATLARAIGATGWLLDNTSAEDTPGWGLAFDWDAFGDGTTNPITTVYGITTALAIQALQDVHDVTGEPALLALALDSARHYVQHGIQSDEAGSWAWYSLEESDAYAVLNITAMLAGQFQRLGTADLASVADEFVQHLLSHQLEDGRWMYSALGHPSDGRPNDLVHAAYIVQGLAAYARHGGRIDVGVRDLYESLWAFVRDGVIVEYPNGSSPARDWGVGAALYTARVLETDLGMRARLSRAFLPTAVTYGMDGGPFYPRQAAHVLLGLAAVR